MKLLRMRLPISPHSSVFTVTWYKCCCCDNTRQDICNEKHSPIVVALWTYTALWLGDCTLDERLWLGDCTPDGHIYTENVWVLSDINCLASFSISRSILLLIVAVICTYHYSQPEFIEYLNAPVLINPFNTEWTLPSIVLDGTKVFCRGERVKFTANSHSFVFTLHT